MTATTTPDPSDSEPTGAGRPEHDIGPGGVPALVRRHWPLLAAGVALVICLVALVTARAQLADSEALADERAEEIVDLDAEVTAMGEEIGDLEDDLRRSESSLSVMRSARDEAVAAAAACEELPGDVTALLEWVVDFIEWSELSRTNIAAAAAQGDAMVAEQERVLDPLGESLERCRDAS